MNGRVYNPEIGRFLSADPHVQAPDNLQSWNRYSYVLNNPLSYTDPTGFFFSKLFKALGKALGSLFKAIGNAIKKILKSPIFRAIIGIVACAAVGPLCGVAQGVLTLAGGGSISDALKAMATSFVQMGIFSAVGPTLNALVASEGLGGAGDNAPYAMRARGLVRAARPASDVGPVGSEAVMTATAAGAHPGFSA